MPKYQEMVESDKQGNWILLTENDVTEISFQVKVGAWELRGTIGAVPPALNDDTRGWEYEEGDGLLNVALSDLFKEPGVNRIYGRGREFQSFILIDHA